MRGFCLASCSLASVRVKAILFAVSRLGEFGGVAWRHGEVKLRLWHVVVIMGAAVAGLAYGAVRKARAAALMYILHGRPCVGRGVSIISTLGFGQLVRGL